MLARYAQNIIPRLEDNFSFVCATALATLEKLPLLALVPHRHRLAAAAPLRGRVRLVMWRQLFWGERLLWYWGSRGAI